MLAIPVVVLLGKVLERESEGETAAYRLGAEFVWPESPRADDPGVALRILTEAATVTNAAVLRTTVTTSPSERKHITHYVLLGRDRTALTDEFTLSEGRWLTAAESRGGPVTVSSARAGEAGNVGVPSVLGDRYDLTFAPLRQAFDALPAAGRYVVETPDRAATERFLAIVHQRLAEAGVAGLTTADLTPDPSRAPAEKRASLNTLTALLAVAATLIIVFILLREGKRIGVLRLLGHPATRIWYEVVGRVQAASILGGLVACSAIVLAVPGVDPVFLRSLAGTVIPVTAAGFAATLGVGLIVVNRVQVPDLVKGSLQ
ncbi:hypothetical protein [Amycolatopsis sp. MtRt-6]|uniref:hypothetical protein n=1 Tax=Amycolatopsis sp. MtRt-6 TaxID=2792782 RepID=UPI001A8C67EC|nr:hypothetical protein [Amycolatopsis sp. MtRt-6]